MTQSLRTFSAGPGRRIRQNARQSGLPCLLLCASLFTTHPALAEFSHSVEEGTDLESWQWSDAGASFSFNQQVPDQARAFFQARGFSSEQSEFIAQSCLFGIIIRNPAGNDRAMALDLTRWRVIENNGPTHAPQLEETWHPQWQTLNVSQAARIAFRWALFPSQQTFQPGDWNMGLITLGPPPGAQFDLEVTWLDGDTPRTVRFNKMRCGPDRSL